MSKSMAAGLAPVRSAKIVSSTNNIATTYGTGAGSLALSDVAFGTTIGIINGTGGSIAVNYQTDNASSAPSTGDGEVYVPAGGAATYDTTPIHKCIYVRSDSGSTLSSGTVSIVVT